MSELLHDGKIRLVEISPALFLLQIEEVGISWLFNAWPDAAKFLIQKEMHFTGIVYPDRLTQSSRGISCNLVEFPLLHALFNEGMFMRGEKPILIGTARQLELANESFGRGLYGFYKREELEDCDLTEEQKDAIMREITALSLKKEIVPAETMLDELELRPLEEFPSVRTATEYRGAKIWKKDLNVFCVEYGDERVTIDCNLKEGQHYDPPLKIDVKNIPYRLFQIIDTGEEDGFSPKSCMHTVIQWRDRIICVDLPMNVPYLLEKVSISRTEIDAVIFTHNHDDHIGEFAMLLQADRKMTVICPKVIWKSILLKASAMFDLSVEDLEGFFNHLPIAYGEEFDYAGLKIVAHPSIHPVPCAIYHISGIVNGKWKSYSHMSDILNFMRCQTLVKEGAISEERYEAYRDFILEPATVKKIDVGARDGTEEFAVHGNWRDFIEDKSQHIVLGHIRDDLLDERATVLVGQLAVAGSARNMMDEDDAAYYQDKHRERAVHHLSNYLFSLLEQDLREGKITREKVLSYLHILADNEIRLIQANTPFLKMGVESKFVDLVISGLGSVWVDREGEIVKVANVNAGDVIGDMGVLNEIPRTATIRADSYMYVLRIPGLLFRQIAIWLGIYNDDANVESVLERIWSLRELVQGSDLFGTEVPIYLQNKISQYAERVTVSGGEKLPDLDRAIWLCGRAEHIRMTYRGEELPEEAIFPPVYGESVYCREIPEKYEVEVLERTHFLRLPVERFAWVEDVPIFRLRLRQLHERRSLYLRQIEKRLEKA